MKYIRWTAAWTLYGIGHSVSKLMEWLDWEWSSYPLYCLYNRLMLVSCDVQGPGSFGPWNEGGLPGSATGSL